MKIVVPLVLVALAGLVLGPGQLIYCIFLSGAPAGEYPCTPGQPVVVALSPDQNPLRFNASIEWDKPRIATVNKSTKFDGVLSFAGEELWSERFGVSDGGNNSGSGTHRGGSGGRNIRINAGMTVTTTGIRSFSVDAPGDYTFVAKNTTDNAIDVRSITLKVRQHVRLSHVPSMVAGWVMLMAPIMLGIALILRRSFRTRAATS